ncbi:hypothetical protein D3C76_666130 [compost metagenome]
MAFAAAQQLCSVGQSVLHVFFDLGHGALVDQWPLGDAIIETAADLELRNPLGQACDKGVVDAGLHQEAIDADAGLPGVAEFGDQRAVNRAFQIGIVEDNERRVAAQLQRDFFQGRRALGHQQFADGGGAGERQFAHKAAGGQLATDGDGIAGDHVENARWNPGLFRQRSHGQCRERCFRGWLDDARATGRQCRAGLAGDHRRREVPRRDGRDDANRLLADHDARIALVAGNGVAVDALGLFGEPLDEARGVEDFAFGFGQWLALFEGEDVCQGVGVFQHQGMPALERIAALLGGQRAPGRPGLVGGLDSQARMLGAEVRHLADQFTGGRVEDVLTGAIRRVQPLAIDVGLLTEQLRGCWAHAGSLVEWWTLWERACSRRRCIRRHQCWMCRPLREQARSHRGIVFNHQARVGRGPSLPLW